MMGKDGSLTPGQRSIPTQLPLYQENGFSVSRPFPSSYLSFDIARCFRGFFFFFLRFGIFFFFFLVCAAQHVKS